MAADSGEGLGDRHDLEAGSLINGFGIRPCTKDMYAVEEAQGIRE